MLLIQVHLYNQELGAGLEASGQRIGFEKINANINASTFLNKRPQQVNKIPFNISQEFPYFNTAYMNDPKKLKRVAAG